MPRILPSAASVSAIRSSSNFGRPDWARFVIPPGRSRLRIPREYSYISFLMVYIYICNCREDYREGYSDFVDLQCEVMQHRKTARGTSESNSWKTV